ncbi:TolB family protein [Arenimonas donghaensis]|uniref:Dipeptidylpeptidase IV N-terminal domain-containing protein n=1 Tax=Arenimonas donghaensis DSM 18148 = HO3-R19 TaxID=1121014 RepID=A0A087MLF4_9GAMM|nr:PD40 domain-containing protein [Arenimonas donghaensis]KFL37707.1 hypothetical protein N788_00630 [Arenimonas donghaensis DSM 18148 = HO3-R19]
MARARLILLFAASLATASAAGANRVFPDDPAVVRLGAGWLSTLANDYNLSTDAGEQLLVFGRSSRGDFSDSRVWVARQEDGQWSDPQPAPFSDPRWRDSDPWLTPDGRWLYFVSSRPAAAREPGREDLDLWRAPVTDGRIGEPEHLAMASSPGEELGPELHQGWLVFNSTRPGGPAQMALYRARVTDTGLDAPEAMPAPFNDGLVQGDLTFSPDGQLALFWSIRGDSREPDLFAVRREGGHWSAAVRLSAPFNQPGMDFTPAFTANGKHLRWASQRQGPEGPADPEGSADLYQAGTGLLEALLE